MVSLSQGQYLGQYIEQYVPIFYMFNICGSGDEVPGAEPDGGGAAGHDQRGGRRRQRHHRLPRVPHHDGKENEGHRQVGCSKKKIRKMVHKGSQ